MYLFEAANTFDFGFEFTLSIINNANLWDWPTLFWPYIYFDSKQDNE